MKNFLLYLFLVIGVLAAIFVYILYSEGAFKSYEPTEKSQLEPFMKCEAGKCGEGKCGTN